MDKEFIKLWNQRSKYQPFSGGKVNDLERLNKKLDLILKMLSANSMSQSSMNLNRGGDMFKHNIKHKSHDVMFGVNDLDAYAQHSMFHLNDMNYEGADHDDNNNQSVGGKSKRKESEWNKKIKKAYAMLEKKGKPKNMKNAVALAKKL